MLQYLMFLGDSTPRDDHIRKELVKRLAVPIRRPERDLLPLDERIARLERLLAEESASRFVLMGRSSGARVVTQVAANPVFSDRIAAVVAVGYPFCNPRRGHEPERYMHLHHLEAPCLIVQGRDDEYGGPSSVAAYNLPAGINVRFFDTNHRLEPPEGVWAEIGACIRDFLGEIIRAPGPETRSAA